MYIVTGGAGFIGSNIVAALEERGRVPITVSDWLDDKDKARNLEKRRRTTVIPPEELAAFLDANKGKIEAIIHMGPSRRPRPPTSTRFSKIISSFPWTSGAGALSTASAFSMLPRPPPTAAASMVSRTIPPSPPWPGCGRSTPTAGRNICSTAGLRGWLKKARQRRRNGPGSSSSTSSVPTNTTKGP